MLNVAIVGAGIIGGNHADAIVRHPRLRVAAVVDSVPAAATALASRVDPAPVVFSTLVDALASGGIDLVAICTPSGLHVEAAEETLRAGAHLLVEKPLDVSLPKARAFAKVAAEAEARGLVCAMVSQHRFDPALVAVRQAFEQGRLGRLTSAVVSMPWFREQSYYDSADWRGTWAFDGGGALANQGIHLVDQMLSLLGRPAEVYAQTARVSHERIEVEDLAAATIRFASGALAVLHATTSARPGLPVRLAVHGTEGSAVLHDDQLEYFWSADGGDVPLPASERFGAAKEPDAFVVGHLRQYDDLVEAIETGRPPGVRVADGLLALALVRAVYVSATLGRPVGFEQVLDGAFDDVMPFVEELS
ncbi:Gfo/Idh/MocA family oxidoreductase [Dactylosporangium sp. AC04546]|uniref:Gfo/Idh/MocA family protein n=1 Tax=Dactylosporangium sp. AC04546 TaxID=2862460 RepID=UPI001EE100FD|nr:Gfo/Idh/MocA family oxidoreductase [Dactylosporangium sp. AC04546]WVK87640.1 Gfo/Idh/MocA family oxidoreductase [Dactylosporangium sp. AC04546]